MPVKISMDKPTNAQKGIVHISDVHQMLTDFRKKIELDCIDTSRNPVQKRFYFDIEVERLTKIVSTIPGMKKAIRINLSVTLPGQLNCEQNDSIENSLSILVCGVAEVAEDKSKGKGKTKGKDNQDEGKKVREPMLGDGNLILVEGFKDSDDTKITDNPCCVQGSPFLNV